MLWTFPKLDKGRNEKFGAKEWKFKITLGTCNLGMVLVNSMGEGTTDAEDALATRIMSIYLSNDLRNTQGQVSKKVFKN